MTGEFFLAMTILLIAVFVLVMLVAWLVYQQVQATKTASETASSMLELVEKQAALIAAKDALAYQAIRAVDVYSGYDEGSNSPVTEEIDGGSGADDGAIDDAGFGNDPFVTGDLSKF